MGARGAGEDAFSAKSTAEFQACNQRVESHCEAQPGQRRRWKRGAGVGSDLCAASVAESEEVLMMEVELVTGDSVQELEERVQNKLPRWDLQGTVVVHASHSARAMDGAQARWA
jgi:hypothetical protein